MTDKPSSARKTYEAYLKGEITPSQVEQRAQDWYASQKGLRAKPAKGG